MENCPLACKNKILSCLLRILIYFWRRPIFPGRHQPSIFGTEKLNCRVRDGNGCVLLVISTRNLYKLFKCIRMHPQNYIMLRNLRHDVLLFNAKDLFHTCFFGQALDLLVSVSSMHYCTYTPDLSTTSSAWGLTHCWWDISSWG